MPELFVNGQVFTVPGPALTQSLLDVLRLQLGLTGTKEGCASGDCGACTVVCEDPVHGVRTVNSCITPAGAAIGAQVLTVEGLAGNHPVQYAMVACHGSQCGFCTPGFVMALVGDQLTRESSGTLLRDDAVLAVSGNLCRCTGYRPIVEAAQQAWVEQDRAQENQNLLAREFPSVQPQAEYARPQSVGALQTQQAPLQVVAGGTDLWLAATQQYRDFDNLLDVSDVAEWRVLQRVADEIHLGAAATHAELLTWFAGQGAGYADICHMLHRFGSPQIRGRGTLGGNIANASPVADWPPVLLALGAQLELLAQDGVTRELPLANFYQAYKQTALQPGELLTRVRFAALAEHQQLHVRKITKRYEDDISSVLGVVFLQLDDSGAIQTARIAFGGMAATPILLPETAAHLHGLVPGQVSDVQLAEVGGSLDRSMAPLSDVRASSSYRLAMARQMLHQVLQPEHNREDLYDL